MKTKTKVQIVTSAYGTDVGGVSISEKALINELRKKMSNDIEVVIAGGISALEYSKAIKASWSPRFRGIGIPKIFKSEITHYLGLKIRPNIKEKFILTIHDLCSIHFSDEEKLPVWLNDVLPYASAVIVPSAFTKSEVMRYLNYEATKIHIVPNGPGILDQSVMHETTKFDLEVLGLTAPFIIRVGGYTLRKNVDWLLNCWPEISRSIPELTLLLVGTPNNRDSNSLNKLQELSGVINLGHVPRNLLKMLMSSATALLSPSIYEGFGLPMLEAMKLGTPVIAKETDFAKELCDESALYVNSSEDIVKYLSVLLSDPNFREMIIFRGLERASQFSWEKSAVLLKDIYQTVASDIRLN